MDSHSIVIDFEIFQQMAENSFADSLQKAIDNFANQLIEKRQSGKKITFFCTTPGITNTYF